MSKTRHDFSLGMLLFVLGAIYIMFFGIEKVKDSADSCQCDIQGLNQSKENIVQDSVFSGLSDQSLVLYKEKNKQKSIARQGLGDGDGKKKMLGGSQRSPVMIDNKKFFSTQSLFNNVRDNEVVSSDQLIESNRQNFSGVVQKIGNYHTIQGRTANKKNTIKNNIIMLRQDLWQWRPDVAVQYAGLKSLESVGLEEFGRYILKDKENTHYVFLQYTHKDILRQYVEYALIPQGGNLLAITNKKDINKRRGFGDEVWELISIYSQEKRKTLLIVFFDSFHEARFIQIDNDVVNEKKKELQSMFLSRYGP